MAKWQVNNPIRYDVPPQQGGDTVYNGFFKTANEFSNIYNYLNSLRICRASNTPPTDAEVNEIWLDTSVNPPILRRWDGASWVDVKVGLTNNSDKVDGFDASQTPTANTIPVADSTGKISTGWLNASTTPTANTIPVLDANGILNLPNTPAIITNTYTFRRVNLTGATSDYSLAVGEEAFYTMTNTNTLSLRIAVQTGAVYEIIFRDYTPPPSSATASHLYLYPNNTSYSGQFNVVIIYYLNGGSSVGGYSTTSASVFGFDQVGGGVARAIVDTNNYVLLSTTYAKFTNNTTAGQIIYIANHWKTPTTWTSLGTLNTSHTVSSGTVLVRRIA